MRAREGARMLVMIRVRDGVVAKSCSRVERGCDRDALMGVLTCARRSLLCLGGEAEDGAGAETKSRLRGDNTMGDLAGIYYSDECLQKGGGLG